MSASTITYSDQMAPRFALGVSNAHAGDRRGTAQGYVTLARRYVR
jgi:hypothetical protein